MPRVEALEDRLVPAQTYTWVGQDPMGGNWSVPTNWSPLGPPGPGDTAKFDGKIKDTPATMNLGGGAFYNVGKLMVINGYDKTITLNASLWVDVLQMSGGTITGARLIINQRTADVDAPATVFGASSWTAGAINTDTSVQGEDAHRETLDITGGGFTPPQIGGNFTVTNMNSTVNWTQGDLTVVGGKTVTNGGNFLADSQFATMGNTGGLAGAWTFINKGNLYLGDGKFSNLKGNGVQNQGGKIFKQQANAGGDNTFTIDGPLVQDSGGTTDVQSGVLAVVNDFTQSDSGSGTVVEGGQTLTVGGVLAQNGGSFSLGGYMGGGNLTASGGYQLASNTTFSGYGSVSGNVTNAGAFGVMGFEGSGSLNLTGNYTQNDGTTTVASGMSFSGSGTFTQAGGTTTVAGSDTVSFRGAVAINGGTFTLGDGQAGANLDAPAGLQVGSGGTLVASGSIYGDVTNGGTVDDYDALLTISGNYTQAAGGATFVAGNGLTVNGLLEEQGGTFTIAGAVVTTGGDWLIDNGASLVGNGLITLNSNLTNAGTIDLEGGSGPGPIPGSISINGNFTQTSTGDLEVHLYGDADYDALSVSGTATLAGTLDVTNRGGFLANPGDVFSVLSYGMLQGQFDGINLPGVSRGGWSVRYGDPSYPNQLTLWVIE